MKIVNIHKAKTHLSRLLEQVALGEGFIIAKAGKPVAKIMPLDAPEAHQVKRFGFMTDKLNVPEDFDTMGRQEIEDQYGGSL
jgi:prevent-host-death family protein